MSEFSIAQHYHERTKYDPESIAAKNKELDWSKQPIPFKEYKIGTSYNLKPYLSKTTPSSKQEESWQRLSRLLFCSYGLTAKMATLFGPPLYLRAAPSAGGLYPAEVYLLSRGTAILPPGLYHYQTQTHSLLHFWEDEVWSALQSACFHHSALENTEIALTTTGVFHRSAWRYEDRAYRRIFLDTGHLLGNIELASAIYDYRAYLIGGFHDEAMDQLLYLDSATEGILSVIPLADLQDADQNFSSSSTALASAIQREYPEIPEGELLAYLHEATKIKTTEPLSLSGESSPEQVALEDKYNFPFCLKIPMKTASISYGERLEGLEETILQRRSTRAYTGEPLEIEELKALLDFTYQSQHYVNQGLTAFPDYFDLNLIETFVVVSGVNNLEEGCYYYAPLAQELRQIRFKNFRRELHFLCLGQDLGRDAGAVLFHTADLQSAIASYGDRAYRYLHMDAGHLGQRLNLAAIRLGLGVSGIGGFFDNQVNEVLGIPEDEAVIYITTLGRPHSSDT